MAQAGTNALPSRGQASVAGAQPAGLPTRVPGGIGGLAPFPSRLTRPLGHVVGGLVPGGAHGTVRLFKPAVDKQVPYIIGRNTGFSIRSTDGRPIQWLRRFFANTAGPDGFIASAPGGAGPDWTSDILGQRRGSAVPIPMGRKHLNFGGYFREAYVDEQLFTQITNRRNPWPIQKPMPKNLVRQGSAQPRMTRPYPYQLTRYQAAASYGQTTQTLLAAALSNLLPSTTATGNPPPTTDNMFGAY